MLHKLHLRLTAFCALITGLIVIILTVICLHISESGMLEQEYSSFESGLNALYQNLSVQSLLSHSWLRQMENNYQISLRLTDNGRPLVFQNIGGSGTENALLDLVEETSASRHGIDIHAASGAGTLIRHAEFALRDGEGQTFFGAAALIPRSGTALGISAFHSLSSLRARIKTQRLAFLLTDGAAILLLTLFSWHFTARMMRPLKENRERQIQFVASASHELRSPLTVILSNVAAVKSGIMANDRQFLDTIDSEGQRMSRLVSDMLQLASADNHSWSMRPSDVELDTLLLQTWEYYEPQALSRHFLWDIRLPEEPVPPCRCDAERIRQLLAILIDNAFSYVSEGGRICLSLEAGSRSLRIAVSDNGPGIPDSQKELIFQRFCRADPSRQSKAHFGLGLCIAREIAQLHRGQLLLTDTPGGGATFTLVLPV